MSTTRLRTAESELVELTRRRRAGAVPYGVLLVLLIPVAALALDGQIDVRGTRQDGGAGETAYETSTLAENYSLSQNIAFHQRLNFQISFLTRRQTLDSKSILGTSTSEILSYLPNASLNYRAERLRGELSARGMRKDHSGSGLVSWRDEHVDFGGWLQSGWDWIELNARARQSASRRETPLGVRNTQERNQGLGVLVHPSVADDVEYRFSRTVQELRTYGTELTFLGHVLQYRGAHGFSSGRGHFAIDANASYLKQVSAFNETGGLEYAAPIWGGFSLDDTPEDLDPLEPDPEFVAALFDQDRDTPTVINIGDSAPIVRQYGGDYRNLIFDFGDTEPMDTIILYVDTILRFPEIMQWRVFTSDDPEGRDWSSELGAGEFTAIWEEMPNGRQGWRFSLSTPISHRRVKLVNFKLGVTEPDILVTEMEVYRFLVEDSPDLEQVVRRYQFRGNVSYDLTEDLNVYYGNDLTGRHFDDTGQDIKGSSHRVGAGLAMGSWRLGAGADWNRVGTTSGRDTDANGQRISLASSDARPLRVRLSAGRNEDKSWTLKNVTHTASGNLTWRAAPRLTFIQTISYGTRQASTLEVDSESWTLMTRIRGRPKPNLEIELSRNDRWVSQEAGVGFTTYNTSQLLSTWALAPQLTWTSQVIYQVREDDDILVRNSVVWRPLPGGSMTFRLHASDFQDTRIDWFQRSAGGAVDWRPRPRLVLEGGIEWVLIKQFDERNTPTNIHFRGRWSF